MSSATALSGVAHFVVLGLLFMAETPEVTDSRILDALDERIVSIEAAVVPPVVFFEPAPEPVEEEEIVEEVEVAELEEPYEPVPTEERFEQEVAPGRDEVASNTEPEPVVEEERVEVAALAPTIDAVPVSEDADSAVAAVRAPVPTSAAPVLVAAAEPTEERLAAPAAVPSADDGIDGEAVERARARYDRAVRTRLAQLGDAPRRILQGAGETGPFEVEFVAIVDERGRIIELRLVRSSGLPELDEFAESSVHRLRRLARVPAELGDEGRRVPISLVYEA